METLKSLLEIIAPNPALLTDPVVAPFIYEIMEISGISPVRFMAKARTAATQQAAKIPAPKPESGLRQAEKQAGINAK